MGRCAAAECEALETPSIGWAGRVLAPLLLASAACSQAPSRLLRDVAFTQVAQPAPELPVLADLEVHAGRLYVAASRNPVMERGAAVLASADGASFDRVLDSPESEGFIRVRSVGRLLMVPDVDPPGTAPGRVWIADDGADFRPARVEGAVHVYDAIEWAGSAMLSGALEGGRVAALFRQEGDVWRAVATARHSRAKWMVVFGSDLLISKRRLGGASDLLRAQDGAGEFSLEPRDVIPGEATTFRWHASSRGRLLWSLHDGAGLRCLSSSDGEEWRPVSGLDGEFVSDFAELEGNLYALTGSGLFGSEDHRSFVKLADAPDGSPFDPVPAGEQLNADASASLASFRGSLYAGASRGGAIYRIEAGAAP